MMKWAYTIRINLAEFFLIFFVIAIFFRSPFDRLIKMMLDLQLMIKLALMHVHIPANALLGMLILKPISEFDFNKDFSKHF